jgi:hypothetical protein
MEEVWTSIWKQGVDQFHSINLVKLEGFEVKLWFCGNRFFFTRQRTPSIVEKSVVYPGREIAMTEWRRERVWWRETFVIESAG